MFSCLVRDLWPQEEVTVDIKNPSPRLKDEICVARRIKQALFLKIFIELCGEFLFFKNPPKSEIDVFALLSSMNFCSKVLELI